MYTVRFISKETDESRSYTEDSLKVMLKDMFTRRMFHAQFQSPEETRRALIETVKGVLEILEPLSSLSKAEKRFRVSCLKLVTAFEKIEGDERFNLYVYNYILAAEGFPLLTGFGFANRFGDKLKGNAERMSIKH